MREFYLSNAHRMGWSLTVPEGCEAAVAVLRAVDTIPDSWTTLKGIGEVMIHTHNKNDESVKYFILFRPE